MESALPRGGGGTSRFRWRAQHEMAEACARAFFFRSLNQLSHFLFSLPSNSLSSMAPPAKRARTADNLAMGMDLGMGMDGGDRGRRR